MGLLTDKFTGQGGLTMRNCKERRFREQFGLLQRQFLQVDQLPFSNVLSETALREALESLNVAWKDRVYSPLITLWVFLSQVISADHSCRAAVARLMAHRFANGQSACHLGLERIAKLASAFQSASLQP